MYVCMLYDIMYVCMHVTYVVCKLMYVCNYVLCMSYVCMSYVCMLFIFFLAV
jgi:hypothetical protein